MRKSRAVQGEGARSNDRSCRMPPVRSTLCRMDFHAYGRGRPSFFVCLSLLLVGGLAVFGVQRTWEYLAPCHTQFSLLNPAFRCLTSSQYSEWDYEPLRANIMEKIIGWQKEGKISHVSVYFRDLIHGPRFGIEEYQNFYPASLLKVPVMIAILHDADRTPGFLDQTLSFSGDLGEVENVEKAEETIQPDTPYTIRELLRKMIVYSDNKSKHVLIGKLNATPPPLVYDTFHDLDVATMMATDGRENISIQGYAALFGVLHNTGYLSRDMSQFALELLAQSTYRDGIVAGVPQGVRVAHKFGVLDTENGESQLHDCGIVYHPSGSYILCVMTSGLRIDDEAAAIADISRMIYEDMDARRF